MCKEKWCKCPTRKEVAEAIALKRVENVGSKRVIHECGASHHGQMDLNKKSGTMHQTLISFNIDAQGFRKRKNENPSTWEMGVTS